MTVPEKNRSDRQPERSVRPHYASGIEMSKPPPVERYPKRFPWMPVLLGLLLVIMGAAGFGSSVGWYDHLSLLSSTHERNGSQAETPAEQVDMTATSPTMEISSQLAPLPLKAIAPATGEEVIAEGHAVALHLVETTGAMPEALEMQARFEFEFGAPEKAAGLWTKILERDPQNAYALAGLSDVATLEGRLSEAVRLLRRSVLANPRDLERQLKLATTLVQNGELEEARQILSSAVQAYPNSVQVHVQLGTLLNQLGDHATAQEHFESAVELAPDHAGAHYGLATALARLGDNERAAEHRQQHVRLRTDFESGRSEREDYDDVAALKIDVGNLYTDMARVYLAAGQTKNAELLLLRATRMNPTAVEPRQALAWIASEKGFNFEAIRWLRQISELRSDDFSYTREIARLYAIVDQIEESERILLDFVERNPKHSDGLNALAQFYLDAAPDDDKALHYATRDVESAESPQAYAFLATVHEERGEIEKAVAALGNALELDPNNAEYLQRLALLKDTEDPSDKSSSNTAETIPQ